MARLVPWFYFMTFRWTLRLRLFNVRQGPQNGLLKVRRKEDATKVMINNDNYRI
jgi:hypothetical protein